MSSCAASKPLLLDPEQFCRVHQESFSLTPDASTDGLQRISAQVFFDSEGRIHAIKRTRPLAQVALIVVGIVIALAVVVSALL